MATGLPEEVGPDHAAHYAHIDPRRQLALNMPLGQPRNRPDGPIYVVSVSGPKMYDIGLQNWMDRAASNTQLFQTISIDGNKLAYQAYTVTGQKYDSFTLLKGKNRKNTLTDQAPLLAPERLDLPAEFLKRYKPEQMEEYKTRYQEYRARKEAKNNN